jgi:hypothetical protein
MYAWKVVLFTPVILTALYIILRRPEDREAREWAFGALGAILGYLVAS